MGLWLDEHEQGQGFGLTKILLIASIGLVAYLLLIKKNDN